MKRLYLLDLNPHAKGSVDRFAVMQLREDGTMDPLWGDLGEGKSVNDNPRKAAKAWPYMVYSPRPSSGPDRYPAFHFAIRGFGINKQHELAEALALKLGEDVELIPVTGWNTKSVIGRVS
ncbi:hypothetical protein [Caulobacter sp. Root343]|uniref:hypothetical protein n=1 Tax=Caulobacter sp. Root343 TaxID=1736520 RepID=UPI0006F8F3B5|nr:hypothetical protein [Caulobacter sp. Root343]KQV66668.1 hypothetical protein ASC70_12610 [Caulobacter sp. Root343]